MLAYLDDVMVLGQSFDEHLDNLRAVFERFRANNLKLKPRKCELFRRQLKFLGWNVGNSGIEVPTENMAAVLKRTRPMNVREVQSFLGYVNYHLGHIEKYAELAAPLCALTRKKNSKANVWEPKQWEQLSRPPDKCDCYQTGNDLGCNYCTRMSKLWEQLSRPPDKCVCHQTGNDLGCNHYTRLSKLWEQLSRPPDRCDCYLVGNNLSKLPCGGCNYCIRMNKQWEQLTRPPDECNCYQAGNDPSKLPCGGCNYCTRMSKQWEQFH